MHHIKTPRELLRDLDSPAATALVAAATDLVLILDREGVIHDSAVGTDETLRRASRSWQGRRWGDVVTMESRPKIEATVKDAIDGSSPRWRQVNHPSPDGGADIPVLYAAVLDSQNDSRIVALGRDLRATAALQQRLVAAQRSMEQDYLRFKHIETRYRLLFETSKEAVLIVDPQTYKVVEGNSAAAELLGLGPKRIVGEAFPFAFEDEDADAVRALLAWVRAVGRTEDVHVRLAGGTQCEVSASLFRLEASPLLLIRITQIVPSGVTSLASGDDARVLKLVEQAPDGFVVTGADGRVLTANQAFLDLAQLVNEEQARGQPLERWVGQPGVGLAVVSASMREHGSIRLFETRLQGEHGASTDVEISGVAMLSAGHPCLGYTIRDTAGRLNTHSRPLHEIPRSVEQLTELVGRVSLKDLVRQTTDVIERMCIEAALELTDDNRASAAEMLGVSRQSLYAKLRRYGLGDLTTENNGRGSP